MKHLSLSLLILCAPLAHASTTPELAEPQKAVTQASQGHAVLLDVRDPDEVGRGALRNAVKIPISKFGTPEGDDAIASLPKDKPVYVYCERGGRAEKATKALRKVGIQAMNVGGYEDLKKHER